MTFTRKGKEVAANGNITYKIRNFVAHNANVAHGNEIDCNNKT